MTSTKYRDALDRLALGPAGAAKLLGVTERTHFNYASGATAIPGPVRNLLLLVLAGNITVETAIGRMA